MKIISPAFFYVGFFSYISIVIETDTNTNHMKKVLSFIYRNNLGDCTNNGLSSQVNHSYFVWDIDPLNQEKVLEEFSEENGEEFFVIKERTIFGEYSAIAIPYTIWKSGRHSMSGGNFLYTSDSRFPSNAPIAIHDRVEN